MKKTKTKTKNKSKSKLSQSQKQVINNIIKIETQKRKRRTGRRLTRPKEREQPIRNIDSHASGLLRSAGIQKNIDNTQYEQLKTYLIEQIKKNDEDNYNKAIQNFRGVREEKLIVDKHERLSSKPRITNSSFNVRSGDLINDSRISDRGSINNENRINDRGSIENYNRLNERIETLEDDKKNTEKVISDGSTVIGKLQSEVKVLNKKVFEEQLKKQNKKITNKLKSSEKVECPDCGKELTKSNLARHRRTHENQLDNTQQINESDSEDIETDVKKSSSENFEL